jgi:hypothetical protein
MGYGSVQMLCCRKPERVAMQAVLEKDFSPRGSQGNAVVCVSWIWVYKDPAQNVYELGFIVVHQLVPSEHWDTWSLHIYLYMKSMQLGWRSHINVFSVFTQPSDKENYKNIYHLNPLSYLSMFTPLSPELDQLYLSVYCSITCQLGIHILLARPLSPEHKKHEISSTCSSLFC